MLEDITHITWDTTMQTQITYSYHHLACKYKGHKSPYWQCDLHEVIIMYLVLTYMPGDSYCRQFCPLLYMW